MRKYICAAACLGLVLVNKTVTAQQLAFPGAEGFGKYATGGRTGTVYHVTNLNDAGAGSLRDAVSVPNRIVVFDVAGVIRINERMIVAANIYLAGQTAPGEGITVYGNGWSFSNADNTICRYMKIRMGVVGTSGKDANGIADGHDMIFDHCSVSWGRDENFSINSPNALRITIQNSIVSQGLLTHSAGGLIQTDGGVTLYRNLYADNGTRNNKLKGFNQYVNNIVYNWSAGAYIMGGDSEGESFSNAVGNCFIQGPVDGVRPFSVGNNKYHLYESDNIQDSNRNGSFDPVTIQKTEFGGGPDFQATPYSYPVLPTVAANTLLNDNLPIVGASLPYRDYADYYVVNEVKTFGRKGALIGNENVLPFGVPTTWALWPGTARADTDNDGMPDAWESANGLGPNLASDAMLITANGYTNIENYINGITASYSQDYLRSPLNLVTDSATQNSIYFSWFDYSEKESGFIFERKINGIFTEIGRTGINENHFTLTGLQPEEKDTFRVRAYNGPMYSGYSNELIAKSKPIDVPVIDPASFVPDLSWSGSTNQNWDLLTSNWSQNSLPALFLDSSKLLFSEAGIAGQNINITAKMGPKDILVNSSGDYSFSGPGFIAGTGSLNKTGTGKLIVSTNNTYTGATVLRKGTLEINSLAAGGLPSSIGASANYGFNWVWKGGEINYVGSSTSTDRNAVIDETTEFSVNNAGATVTLTGALSGTGGLIKSGPGKLVLKSINPYEGETIIKGGTIEVIPVSTATEELDIIHNGVAIGSSNILKLQGGTYKTSGGSLTIYENYPFNIFVEDGTSNGFEPYRNANLNCNVSGNGSLTYAITYSRELIQGDWSGFTGTLVANGVGTLTGAERSTLMFDNGIGMPNTRVVTAGNTKIASYQNAQTLYLGGLSGPAGTNLSCGSKTSGGLITWSVGAAGTNETFDGVINNEAYGSTSNSSGITSIIKEGNGSWRLTGTNIYSGTTTISNGQLIINGNNTGTGKTTVTEGTLAGKGILSGDVEIQSGGILEPGDSSINTFTLKGKLDLLAGCIVKIQINKNTGAFDKLAVNGDLMYDGSLVLDTTGVFVEGDIFKIFVPGAAVTGTFAQIIPATPGTGLLWKFKPATGELLVISPGFVDAPSNLVLSASTDIAISKSTVNISWKDNSDNETNFILERSLDSLNFTDIAHPAANSVAYIDAGLDPGTKYFYRIKAIGTSSNSVYSAIAAVTTPALIVAPDAPANPNPANNQVDVVLTSGSLNLSWTGSTNTVSYAVYFGTVAGSLTKLADIPYAALPTYQLNNLGDYQTYYWRIDATNSTGTTMGTQWSFRTASPATVAGDYRAIKTGNWDSTSTTPGIVTDIWETYDGSNWVATTILPNSSVNRITIKNGSTVTLRGTTLVKNIIIEPGATLKSLTSARNLRVAGSVLNYGTFGSSSTSAERINIEGYLQNGTIVLGGTSRYYIVNMNVNLLAQAVELVIDADINMSGYMRGNYSNATSGTATVGQNDDDITITINKGRTVTMGSGSYLQEGSSPTTNTIVEFGNYTYNINGILDMKSTGTSCIVGHTTKTSSITINVNGTWYTGNAMRLASTAAAPTAGPMICNIGTNGIVDAGARAIGSTTATNLVVTNANTGTVFFNIAGNGVLRNKVATTEILFPVGTNGTYSPAKLTNSGTADIISVGVKNTFDNPVNNPNQVVNKQFTITPATPNVAILAIALGWLPADQAVGFSTAAPIVIGHFGNNAWDETTAVFSGSGTIAAPYYAKALGFTSFSPFSVGNTSGFSMSPLALNLLSFSASNNGNGIITNWKTSNEINVKGFTIERSTDGINFIGIGNVAAKNKSGTTDYTFTDVNPLPGLSYYRLKMTDLDGSFTYSKIIPIANRSLNVLSVFPNPFSNSVTVIYPMVVKSASLKLMASDGRLIREIKLSAGSSQTTLDLGNLVKGNYILSLNGDNHYPLMISKQ